MPADVTQVATDCPNPSTCGGSCRSFRLLQTIGIALCFALLLGLLGSYAALVRDGNAGIKQSDYVAYYSASRMIVYGQGSRLYDFHALGQTERDLVRPLRVRNGVLPYVYPADFALALAPLAALPYAASYALWLLANCLLLALSVAALQRYIGLRGRGAVLFWLSSFSFLPVFVGLAQGQTSVLLLALLAGVLLTVLEKQEVAGGALLALALIKPPYVLPFLVVFLLQKRWRALISFGATALCLLGVPLVFLGGASLTGYLQTLVQASGWHAQFGYTAVLNHSIAGFAQLLVPRVALPATLLLDALAILFLAWCTLHAPQQDLPLGLAALVALLISPHVLVHDLTLLLIPVAVAVRRTIIDTQRGTQGVPAGSPRFLATLLVLGYAFTLAGLRLVQIVPLQLSVCAMCALMCWLVRAAVRSRTTPLPITVRPASPHARPLRPATDVPMEDY